MASVQSRSSTSPYTSLVLDAIKKSAGNVYETDATVICRHVFDNHLVPAFEQRTGTRWNGDVSLLGHFPLVEVMAAIQSNINEGLIESQPTTESHRKTVAKYWTDLGFRSTGGDTKYMLSISGKLAALDGFGIVAHQVNNAPLYRHPVMAIVKGCRKFIVID